MPLFPRQPSTTRATKPILPTPAIPPTSIKQKPTGPLLKSVGRPTAKVESIDKFSLVSITEKNGPQNPIFIVKNKKGTVLFATYRSRADAVSWINATPIATLTA